MKRGSRFFVDFTNDGKDKKPGSKGRSVHLLEIRNEKIFYRYYYHSRIRLLKYDTVLKELVNDFDLAEETIIRIISENTKRISEIGAQKPNRGQLKKKYPNFCWSNSTAVLNKDVKEREVFVLK